MGLLEQLAFVGWVQKTWFPEVETDADVLGNLQLSQVDKVKLCMDQAVELVQLLAVEKVLLPGKVVPEDSTVEVEQVKVVEVEISDWVLWKVLQR